ncbi:hypothetical protein D3C87_1787330 [compost metagenome]
MRQQHQRGENRRTGDQWDRQRHDKRFFARGQAAAAAFGAGENHLNGDQKQNNTARDRDGFSA